MVDIARWAADVARPQVEQSRLSELRLLPTAEPRVHLVATRSRQLIW